MNYWENRYSKGGNSGAGSYGEFSEFKADVINKFILNNSIKNICELGCGDGNQLKMINVENYVGYDISETIIRKNIQKFKNDVSKKFTSNIDDIIDTFDLTLSLDVLYHIVNEDDFIKYIDKLFKLSHKYVMIYSTCKEHYENEPTHCYSRIFTSYIKPEWKLISQIKNTTKSEADFYIYHLS